MLELLYHKPNHLNMTVVYSSIKKTTKRPFLCEKFFFLNYITLKLIFLNILQNVAIYLFKYFVSHITVIPRNFLYHMTNQISLKYMFCIILRNTFLAPEYMN